jgi:hypothetical protein
MTDNVFATRPAAGDFTAPDGHVWKIKATGSSQIAETKINGVRIYLYGWAVAPELGDAIARFVISVSGREFSWGAASGPATGDAALDAIAAGGQAAWRAACVRQSVVAAAQSADRYSKAAEQERQEQARFAAALDRLHRKR